MVSEDELNFDESPVDEGDRLLEYFLKKEQMNFLRLINMRVQTRTAAPRSSSRRETFLVTDLFF